MEVVSGVLEGRDLGEEAVVQVFHLLLFAGCVFSVLLCLLPLAVEQSLLLRKQTANIWRSWAS